SRWKAKKTSCVPFVLLCPVYRFQPPPAEDEHASFTLPHGRRPAAVGLSRHLLLRAALGGAVGRRTGPSGVRGSGAPRRPRQLGGPAGAARRRAARNLAPLGPGGARRRPAHAAGARGGALAGETALFRCGGPPTGRDWPSVSPGPRGAGALEPLRTWRPFMYRICRLKTALVPLAALAAVLTLACPGAQAQVVPFKVVGGGVAPDGLPLQTNVAAPHWAVGVGTGLGRYYGQGAFQILQFTSATTGVFDSAEP